MEVWRVKYTTELSSSMLSTQSFSDEYKVKVIILIVYCYRFLFAGWNINIEIRRILTHPSVDTVSTIKVSGNAAKFVLCFRSRQCKLCTFTFCCTHCIHCIHPAGRVSWVNDVIRHSFACYKTLNISGTWWDIDLVRTLFFLIWKVLLNKIKIK